MANSTVIELVQSFCREYGLPVPTGIAGTPDAGALQMRELLQNVGTHVWAFSPWQECLRYVTWTSITGQDQGAIKTLCSEDMANIMPGTFWDLTTTQEITGPVSDVTWMTLTARDVQGPMYNYRIANGRLEVLGPMVEGHSLALIYRSRRWVVPVTGAKKTTFTIDTDTCLFSDSLMKAGLRAFWLRIKQMPHKLEMEIFENMLAAEASSGTAKSVLQLDGTGGTPAAGIVIPLGNWTVP